MALPVPGTRSRTVRGGRKRQVEAGENDKALAALKMFPESDHPTESAIRLLLLARSHGRLDHSEQAQDTRNELAEHLEANPLPPPYDWLNAESVRTGSQSP